MSSIVPEERILAALDVTTTEGHWRGMIRCNTGYSPGQSREPVCDNHRVQVFNCEGQFLSAFHEKGNTSKRLSTPTGICFDVCGDFVFVCEDDIECVSVFKP